MAEGTAGRSGLAHYLFHRHGWRIENVCYLQDLYADPEVRGTGIGRALIEAVYAAADAAGAPSVYWLTQEFNATARRLYDRIGTLDPLHPLQAEARVKCARSPLAPRCAGRLRPGPAAEIAPTPGAPFDGLPLPPMQRLRPARAEPPGAGQHRDRARFPRPRLPSWKAAAPCPSSPASREPVTVRVAARPPPRLGPTSTALLGAAAARGGARHPRRRRGDDANDHWSRSVPRRNAALRCRRPPASSCPACQRWHDYRRNRRSRRASTGPR